MKPEEVQSLFADRLELFAPISGQPTNVNLTQLHEELTAILHPLLYYSEKGIHNLMGLVVNKDNCKVRYGIKFLKTTKPTVCNGYIPNNATHAVCAKAEAVHTAKTTDYHIFAAAERETRYFILAAVEDTWVLELRDPVKLYTAVSPSELLSHLQVLCGGLHSLDVLAL